MLRIQVGMQSGSLIEIHYLGRDGSGRAYNVDVLGPPRLDARDDVNPVLFGFLSRAPRPEPG